MTVALLLSYLCGSVPFGLIFARIFGGVDVRKGGSGNIGATNVLRLTNAYLAALTLALDAAKGWAPVQLANEEVKCLVALFAVLGHCFPIWLKFKGGKGVATTFGALLALDAIVFVIAGLTWLLALFISRRAFISSLVAFVTLPFASAYYAKVTDLAHAERLIASLFAISAIVFVRHLPNLKKSHQQFPHPLKTPSNPH